MVRSGTCCKCGDCCIPSPYPPHEGDCPHLLPANAAGERFCEIHDQPSRPCHGEDFPTVPEVLALYPRCTFSFEGG